MFLSNNYVVVTCQLSKTELLAKKITTMGFQTYYPVQEKLIRVGRRRRPQIKDVLCLPGFLFIADGFQDVRFKGPEKFTLMRMGEAYCRVPKNQLESMEARIRAFGEMSESGIEFEEGELVLITEGPLKGMQGQILGNVKKQDDVYYVETGGFFNKVPVAAVFLQRVESE